ncbi:MAG TPA: 3-oxoacyl-[acyl-carrier-protein] synthase III C-terminal domain-containing protein, partial [Anaerolineae bacterium]|nr:3-oxoacyl-[acyl-carrier-protein] synthase III C-terminal domain-containing protein [Anaerolineae bacterium]
TSAASIPFALCVAIEQGRCKEGDRLVMIGFGAGLTWASAVVQLGLREILLGPRRWLPVHHVRRMGNRVRVAARSIGLRAGSLLLPLYTRVTKRS